MLTVYSTHGSPGASCTTMHIAAHWASTGREVLLIEADPAGGSLSSTLGIQFTPGSASFIASGLPGLSNHLVDHSQDVLFSSLHVMPAPSSPTGARGVFERMSERAEDLRRISEYEMAVIIDGGRITADTANSNLTTLAAGVLVVSRADSDLSGIDGLKGLFGEADGAGRGPVGCAVTVGKSSLSADDWRERWNLIECGSMEMNTAAAGDLAFFLPHNKRKSRKWRSCVERVADKLHEFANPPLSDGLKPSHLPERPMPPGNEEGVGSGIAGGILPEVAHSGTAVAEEVAHSGIADGTGQATQGASEAGLAAAAAGPSDERGLLMAPHQDFQFHEGELLGSGYEQPHFLPPPPEDQPHFLPPPPEDQGHFLPPPPDHQVTQEPAPDARTQAEPGPVLEPHPGQEAQPTAYEQAQPEYQTHPGHQQPTAYEQAQPGNQTHPGHDTQPTAYEQSQPEYQTHPDHQQSPSPDTPPEHHNEPGHPQPEYQPHPDHDTQHTAYQQAQPEYQAHAGHQQSPSPDIRPEHHNEPGHPQPEYQPHPDHDAQPTAYEQAQPGYQVHAGHEPPPSSAPSEYQAESGHPRPEYQTHPGHLRVPQPEPPALSPLPAAAMAATGSFREWAARLHNLHTYTAAAHEQAR